jgi:hypothetical protein
VRMKELLISKGDEIGVQNVVESCNENSEGDKPSLCGDVIAANAPAPESGTAVLDIETKFLEGRFDEALVMANRFLAEHQRIRSESSGIIDTRNWRHVSSPICLGFAIERQKRYIYWKYTDEDTSADELIQVAAIALQSWFELFQLEKHQKRQQSCDKGYRFLLPFLDTFTSSEPGTVPISPMSMDLLTIFIRFLSSPDVHQCWEAMSVSIEVLSLVRSLSFNQDTALNTNADGKCLNTVDEASCKELVIFFFTELVPNHCVSPDAAADLLSAIALTTNISEVLSRNRRHFSADPSENFPHRKNVVQQCLNFCNTDVGNWPHWIQDAFCKCRTNLQAKLREIYDRRRSEKSDRDGNGRDEGTPTIFPLVHDARSMRIFSNSLHNILRILSQQIRLLKTLICDRSMNTLTMSQKRQIQMSCLVVCLTVFGWSRYRKKFSKILGVALSEVVWKPLLEILQAMKP